MRGGLFPPPLSHRRSPRVPPVATPLGKGALIGTRSVPLTAITFYIRCSVSCMPRVQPVALRLVECTKGKP